MTQEAPPHIQGAFPENYRDSTATYGTMATKYTDTSFEPNGSVVPDNGVEFPRDDIVSKKAQKKQFDLKELEGMETHEDLDTQKRRLHKQIVGLRVLIVFLILGLIGLTALFFVA